MAESASRDYFQTLRQSYSRAGLRQQDVAADPLAQFRRWFDEAVAAGVREPNAMTLATVDSDGAPDARIVLLKDLSPAGFSFFTNYESAKGQQLALRPQAALIFFWVDLERQIRVRGEVSRLPRAESAAYFQTRPRASQLGAWASQQSSVLESRGELEERWATLESQYAGQDVPMPGAWGGYRLRPQALEFWQGRESRLHDRLRYRLHNRQQGNEWILERLSP